ncbi:DMT family transporter [Bacillus sp. 03113]|uniref:DMT family transporter n=1 Tax=Bacillus sp. 03113 TaxID=2578211 RepID=UPI00114499B1|nr:EamA family transporter [Bacillus sp. 03113]
MIIVLYVVMCAIFGTTFLAIKIGIDAGLEPIFSAGIRFFLAGMILYMIIGFKDRKNFKLLFQKELMITGFFLTFGTFSALYWAEKYVSSGIAALLSATGPIMILFIQGVILKAKMNRLTIFGGLGGFIGVFLLFLPGLSIEKNSFWLIGCGVIIVGELLYCIGTVYSSSVIKKFNQYSPIALNAVQMTYGGVFLFVFSFFIEKGSLSDLHSFGAISSLIYLIIAGSMLGHTIFYLLVAKTNAFFPTTWLYVSPVIALVIGAIFYHETLQLSMIVGALFILFSLILVNFDKLINTRRSVKPQTIS